MSNFATLVTLGMLEATHDVRVAISTTPPALTCLYISPLPMIAHNSLERLHNSQDLLRSAAAHHECASGRADTSCEKETVPSSPPRELEKSQEVSEPESAAHRLFPRSMRVNNGMPAVVSTVSAIDINWSYCQRCILGPIW